MKQMKNTLFIFALVATFLLAFVITKRFNVYGASSNVTPFTLTTVSYGTVSGQIQDLEKTILRRRSDGATSQVKLRMIGPEWGKNTRRIDYPDGTAILVSDDAHIKSTIKHTTNEMKLTPRDPSTCARTGESVDGQETIDGQKAYRYILPLDGGKSLRIVELRLPALDCIAASFVQQQLDQSQNKWVTTQGSRVESIQFSEPESKYPPAEPGALPCEPLKAA